MPKKITLPKKQPAKTKTRDLPKPDQPQPEPMPAIVPKIETTARVETEAETIARLKRAV